MARGTSPRRESCRTVPHRAATQGEYVITGTGNNLTRNNQLWNTLGTKMGCTSNGGPLENFVGSDAAGGQISALLA